MATRIEGENMVAEHLALCLANATIMYHRVHGFHWNVTGEDFPQWHEKFLEIYEDVYSSLDPLAENIRKVGAFAPFTLLELIELSTVADEVPSSYDALVLVADLLKTNAAMLVCLNKTFKAATAANQQGIANFIAERIDMHQKWNWQLSASL
jgi:starvation-inducible DNA-binding protein